MIPTLGSVQERQRALKGKTTGKGHEAAKSMTGALSSLVQGAA